MQIKMKMLKITKKNILYLKGVNKSKYQKINAFKNKFASL